MDSTYHAAQYLVYEIHNPAPVIPLVLLMNGHKEALKNLANIFKKEKPLAVSPRVSVRE